MSATPLELNTVSNAAQVARILLKDIKPSLDQIDILYNSAGGISATLTDAELAEVASFSGLTKQQVDDAIYALTNIKTALVNSYSALAQLAARA